MEKLENFLDKNLKTIAILTCWYGTYPWYFPYFIHSCKYNPTVDFIIITDNKEVIPDKPGNVKIIDKQLEEIRAIATQKLGFTANIDYSYKLCEYKPAYGFLFFFPNIPFGRRWEKKYNIASTNIM